MDEEKANEGEKIITGFTSLSSGLSREDEEAGG